MKNNIRYIARLKIETQSALSVGSGDKGLVMDRLICRDANGLPFIPGTSMAGVVRHEFEDAERSSKGNMNQIFGFQKPNEDEGRGGRIIFSSAMMLASDNQKVHEGLERIDFEKEDYYRFSKQLSERDHVRISHKGTAVDHHKYEEELVRKGTRFVFEIELIGTKDDLGFWKELLALMQESTFRIGSGTRKGFGQFGVIEGRVRQFDLSEETDLLDYLNKNSSLNQSLDEQWESIKLGSTLGTNWIKYEVTLMPDDFFLFGAGIGDIDESEITKIENGKEYTSVDNSPKTEAYFVWDKNTGRPTLTKESTQLLIPATSVKGALAHRTAFYFNKKRKDKVTIENSGNSGIAKIEKDLGVGNWKNKIDLNINVEKLSYDSNSLEWEKLMEEIENMDYKKNETWKTYTRNLESKANLLEESVPATGEENAAVKALFGYAKQPLSLEERRMQSTDEKENGARGKVIISDVYKVTKKENAKVFNHVAIDRFTGGGIDGALFQEKVVTSDEIKIEIFVERSVLKEEHILAAFEAALDDLKNGQLQLGGNTTKGHGTFNGEWTKTATQLS